VAKSSSGNTVQRTPLSKQRNKHLQTTLIEAAKSRREQSSWSSAMNIRNGPVQGKRRLSLQKPDFGRPSGASCIERFASYTKLVF
jgi:transposase